MKNYCGREAAGFNYVAAGDTLIIHSSLFPIKKAPRLKAGELQSVEKVQFMLGFFAYMR